MEWLIEAGITQGQGIFFFLFIALGILFWRLLVKVMAENNKREERYINTIDTLAESLCEVKEVKTTVDEIRRDLSESNERQEKMLGRLLDRLPATKY